MKPLIFTLGEQILEVKEGLRLGRQGDLKVEDEKASRIHAVVKKINNFMYLEDNNSKNDIYIDGQRVPSVRLKPGMSIFIGNAEIRVSAEDENTPTPISAQPPAGEEKKRWQEVVRYWGQTMLNSGLVDQDCPEFMPFPQVVQLEFIRGLQADTLWTLGFGPRTIGSTSYDLQTLDPQSPEECFQLSVKDRQIVFETKYPRQVLLNGQSKSSDILKDGDQIVFGDTLIEVRLTE